MVAAGERSPGLPGRRSPGMPVADRAHVAAGARDRAHGDRRSRSARARSRTRRSCAGSWPSRGLLDNPLTDRAMVGGVPRMEAAFAAEAERIGAARGAVWGRCRARPGSRARGRTPATCRASVDRPVVAGTDRGSSAAAGWASSTRRSRRRSGAPSRSSWSRPSGRASRGSASASSPSRGSRPSIDHPNVLPVFKAGEEDGLLYLAMRFVDGADLRSLVAAGADARPRQSSAQIGAALDAAHARRLVHRDVKPANVLVARGDHAYLTDFGLVKALDETHRPHAHGRGRRHARLRRAGADPRRGRRPGRAISTRSAACSIYTLTGAVAVPARRHRAQAVGAPLRAAADGPGLPAFDAVIARALAKDPRERYESGAALGAAAIAAAGGVAAARAAAATRRAAASAAIRVAGAGARRQRGGRCSPRSSTPRRAPRCCARRSPRRRRSASSGGSPRCAAGRIRARRSSSPRSPATSRCSAGCTRRWRAFDAETERILVELETVRGRVLADDTAAGERLGGAAGRARDDRRSARIRRWGIRHLGWLSASARRPRRCRHDDHHRQDAPQGTAPLHRDATSSRPRCARSWSRSSATPTRPTSRSTACAAGTSPASTPTAH